MVLDTIHTSTFQKVKALPRSPVPPSEASSTATAFRAPPCSQCPYPEQCNHGEDHIIRDIIRREHLDCRQAKYLETFDKRLVEEEINLTHVDSLATVLESEALDILSPFKDSLKKETKKNQNKFVKEAITGNLMPREGDTDYENDLVTDRMRVTSDYGESEISIPDTASVNPQCLPFVVPSESEQSLRPAQSGFGWQTPSTNFRKPGLRVHTQLPLPSHRRIQTIKGLTPEEEAVAAASAIPSPVINQVPHLSSIDRPARVQTWLHEIIPDNNHCISARTYSDSSPRCYQRSELFVHCESSVPFGASPSWGPPTWMPPLPPPSDGPEDTRLPSFSNVLWGASAPARADTPQSGIYIPGTPNPYGGDGSIMLPPVCETSSLPNLPHQHGQTDSDGDFIMEDFRACHHKTSETNENFGRFGAELRGNSGCETPWLGVLDPQLIIDMGPDKESAVRTRHVSLKPRARLQEDGQATPNFPDREENDHTPPNSCLEYRVAKSSSGYWASQIRAVRRH